MDQLLRQIQVVRQFDVIEESIKIIEESSSILSDLLAQQLAVGKDGQGNPVTVFGRDYYSDRAVFNKEHFGVGLGKITEYITNYMTGAFYKEMFVKVEGSNFYIESKVPYFDQIIRQSGEVIMELSEENLSFFAENILIPEINKRFTEYFNGV